MSKNQWEKSLYFFSRNTDSVVKHEVCNLLQFHEADENSHYPGIPKMLGKKKLSILGYLKEILQNHILDWDKNLLSKGGKKILLKKVAHALPSYAKSVF